MEKLFWNKGMFILEYHPHGESHRIVTEHQFCPEYLFWLGFFSKEKALRQIHKG